jgi:hypothetical protein
VEKKKKKLNGLSSLSRSLVTNNQFFEQLFCRHLGLQYLIVYLKVRFFLDRMF